ncbi:MAG: hypothetical protein ABIH89_03515 [Elusimicrobiota bacterium]
MMSSHFKIKYPHNVNKDEHSSFLAINKSLANKIKNLFTFPWELSTMGGGTKKYSTPEYHMIGAIFLAFIPFLLFIKIDNKYVIYKLILFSVISYVLWGLFTLARIRFYSPAIPAISILAGYSIINIGKINKLLGKILTVAFLILILSNFFFLIPIATNGYQPFSILTGSLSIDEFLSVSRPGYPYPSYNVYKYINDNLSDDKKILIFGDAKCLYIDRKFTAFSVGGLNPLIEYIRQSDNADVLYDNLKSQRYTHLVVNVYETIRTAGYGNLYFSKNDFTILDEFWREHIKLIYTFSDVYLYEIISEKEAAEAHNIPANTAKETYRIFKLQTVLRYMNSKNWENALFELNDLLIKNITDHNIFYLISVCHYYNGDYNTSKKYATMAYNIMPDEKYKKLLNTLKNK